MMARKSFKSRPLFAKNSAPKRRSFFDVDFVVLPAIWGWLKRIAMGLGFLVLFQLVVVLLVLPAALKGSVAPPLPREMVLYLDIDAPITEIRNAPSFADPFAPAAMTLRDYVDALDAAAGDARVKGLVVRLRDAPVSLAQSQELHAALARFRAAGKFSYVYSTSYGEGAGAFGRYYFASAFDQIWMMPLGILDVSGLHAEIPYMRGALDKVGVEPEFFQRKDYKTAYESVTRRTMSAENREMMERLIGDLRKVMTQGILENRGVSPEGFARAVDQGFLSAQDAAAAALITHADYADVLVGNVKEAITGDREAADDVFVSLSGYAAQIPDVSAKGKVALVYAVGAIMPSADGGSPLGAGGVAAAEEIAPAIMAAAEDEAVGAIVLRIDSPGGSPTASESILRAVEKAQEKGKTVIVSMGATAASGGYWIAAYADQIFVLPSTITGSIGVVGGKFSLAGLWENIGVNWARISWGANAGLMSFNKPFSKSEAKQFNVMLDAIYDAFIARVSKGRGMTPEAVDAIAGGRVWSGVRAVELGLADQIGGLNAALDYAAQGLGYDSRADLDVVVLPRPKTPIEQLMLLLEGQVAIGTFMRENVHLFEAFRSVSHAAWEAQHADDLGVYSSLPAVQ